MRIHNQSRTDATIGILSWIFCLFIKKPRQVPRQWHQKMWLFSWENILTLAGCACSERHVASFFKFNLFFTTFIWTCNYVYVARIDFSSNFLVIYLVFLTPKTTFSCCCSFFADTAWFIVYSVFFCMSWNENWLFLQEPACRPLSRLRLFSFIFLLLLPTDSSTQTCSSEILVEYNSDLAIFRWPWHLPESSALLAQTPPY